ncbi:MAG: primosomal protein N' [Ruminococcaceae bacterium]|nr:primosomal protein N' [Oscillospiraceae bacterium]
MVRTLKKMTFCTWFEAVRAALPLGAQYRPAKEQGSWKLKRRLERSTETVYTVCEAAVCALEAELAGETLGEGSTKTTGAVDAALDMRDIEAVDAGGVETDAAAAAPKAARPRPLTAKQRQVLDCLKAGPRSLNEICELCGVSRAVPAMLARRGLLQASERDRQLPVAACTAASDADTAPYALTPAQAEVTDTLAARMREEKPKPALLYGVTGSGKTPVFIELLRHALAAGKTALVLVPEIGLTPQMLHRLRAAFGEQVAVQHSGMSPTERLLQWKSIRAGAARVVVGTRSAVFAPLEDIGLIIVDEEQEHSYQSESAPRYDAVDMARRRATYHGALLLLASATPLVAHMHAARAGRLELFRLEKRYGDVPMPAVQRVDMRQELLAGNASTLSRALAEGMEAAIAGGGQVILLLNRRGYHRVAVCKSCGKAVKCGECSVPMVYHKAGGPHLEGRLLCHYCGRSMPPPDTCPECGGDLRYSGFGTQRLEEELAQRLPNARVLRMDLDTTGRRGSHAGMLARFAAGEYDILLGTQMVAKGLDFERVRLVGVIGIDSLLFSQGYRAYENVFALVTQVVGRAGRTGAQGQAIIQTVDPDNPVLTLAAQQDYDAFYQQEIAFRKLALYPPFCTLCVVGFAAQTEADALAAAGTFAGLLAGRAAMAPDIPLRVLGPAPLPVKQLAGSYRYRLTLKCRADTAFRALLRQALQDYHDAGWPRKATVWVDFHSDG